MKWRVKKARPFIGGWKIISPLGRVFYEDTFADAIWQVDRMIRKHPVTLKPTYGRDPEVHWIGPGDTTALCILEDREAAALIGGTQPVSSGLVRFPITQLPELATAALTLHSQYLALLDREGQYEEVSFDD